MTPATLQEAAELIAAQQKPLCFAGAGTKAAPPADRAVLSTLKLSRVVEYTPSDQVVTVEAGVTLQSLQKKLAEHGQRLSLDPPFAERATIGGIVATASFGPRRMRFGAVRDLILGVTMVRTDGVVARGGGKVVKNVAGFDLPKLMCGSHGTLGLIANATFRVHPLPEVTRVLRAQASAEGVVQLMERIRAAQLEPAAMIATRSGAVFDVDLVFEGFEKGVAQQLSKLPDLQNVDAGVLDDHRKLREQLPVRVRALPTELPRVQAEGRFTWYPMLGLGFADGPRAAPRKPAASDLHDAVKQRFDPNSLLPSLWNAS